MQINPYLHFNGDCEEAMNFYAKILGGKVEALHRFAGAPIEGQFPADWKNKIMHITITAHGQSIMASDAPPGRYHRPQGLWVSLNLTSVPDAERIYKSFAEGGTEVMAIQQTFWAERFGMCIDRFGTPWMINCHKPQ